MVYTTYILWSSSLKRYYVGSTNNLTDRLFRHNSGHEKYTSKGCPWLLIWTFSFEERKSAYQLEVRIKKRGIKRYLIDQNIEPI